jgi:hypothetical protein
LAGSDGPDTVRDATTGEAGSAPQPDAATPITTAAGVAAAGYTRDALEVLGWQEVRAIAHDLDVHVGVGIQGRPSKALLIDGILAKQEG